VVNSEKANMNRDESGQNAIYICPENHCLISIGKLWNNVAWKRFDQEV